MSFLGDLIEGGSRSPISTKESVFESHLDCIMDWLDSPKTKEIINSIPDSRQLREKLLSDRNIISAKLRTLNLAIRAYEKGYNSVTYFTGKSGQEDKHEEFIEKTHPNSVMAMKNHVQLIDSLEKNLLTNADLMLRLVREFAFKNKKKDFSAHIAILQDTITQFSDSFEKVKTAIIALPADARMAS